MHTSQKNISYWIQTALVVAESGSPTTAAKHLGINVTTVYRHLEALEQSLESKIFHRKNTGWKLYEEASVLLTAGKEIKKILQNTENELRDKLGKGNRNLRIAVSDDFAFHYLVPKLKKFCDAYKDIRPDIIISSEFTDLENGDADVAIRPDKNPGDSLIGRRVGSMNHAFYASKDYISQHGKPSTLSDLNDHVFCGYGQALQHYNAAKWIEKNIQDKNIVARFSNSTVLMNAVNSGVGIGLLPCYVGDNNAFLNIVMPIKDTMPVDIWLVATQASKNHLKIKAFFDYFAEEFHADHNLFKGLPYL